MNRNFGQGGDIGQGPSIPCTGTEGLYGLYSNILKLWLASCNIAKFKQMIGVPLIYHSSELWTVWRDDCNTSRSGTPSCQKMGGWPQLFSIPGWAGQRRGSCMASINFRVLCQQLLWLILSHPLRCTHAAKYCPPWDDGRTTLFQYLRAWRFPAH